MAEARSAWRLANRWRPGRNRHRGRRASRDERHATARRWLRNIITAMPEGSDRNEGFGRRPADHVDDRAARGAGASGRPAVSVLDVLPTRVVAPELFASCARSARNLLAAPVAEGGTKPTSTVSVVAVENRLRVVAHIYRANLALSPVGRGQPLNVSSRTSSSTELRKAVETEVLSGDGTGEHFTGILNTSGIVAQAFATDALTSVRTALTVLHVSGYEPGVVVLSATDWQNIEMQAATTTGRRLSGRARGRHQPGVCGAIPWCCPRGSASRPAW